VAGLDELEDCTPRLVGATAVGLVGLDRGLDVAALLFERRPVRSVCGVEGLLLLLDALTRRGRIAEDADEHAERGGREHGRVDEPGQAADQTADAALAARPGRVLLDPLHGFRRAR